LDDLFASSLKPCALPALSKILSETLRELEGSIIEVSSVEGCLMQRSWPPPLMER